jgi:hypothetical protein
MSTMTEFNNKVIEEFRANGGKLGSRLGGVGGDVSGHQGYSRLLHEPIWRY